MMKLDSFKDLYIAELRDIYDSESQLIKLLPSMAESAILPDLRRIFAQQLEQTQIHLQRLEVILNQLGVRPTGNSSKTMGGLIADCNGLIDEERRADPGVLDAALIAAAQKIAHCQIAGYGCARTFAEILGERDAAEVLQESLDEEGNTNKMLTSLAMRSVNVEALEATDENAQLSEAIFSALDAVAK